jgi:multiple sugar transport system substrate-binding protein
MSTLKSQPLKKQAMRSLSRREFLRWAGAVGVGMTAAACVPATPQVVVVTPTPASKPQVVSVDWWYVWGGVWNTAIQKVIARFNELNPDIIVNGLTTPGAHEKVLTAVAGGNPPDLFTAVYVSELAARNAAVELTPMIEASEVIKKENYTDAQWRQATWKGKIYGVPAVENGFHFALVWNKNLFQKAGLDPDKPPTTWQETSALFDKLTTFDQAGNVDILGYDPMDAIGTDTEWWYASAGVKWYDEAAGKLNLNDPLAVEAVEWISSFYKKVGPEKMTAFRSAFGTWTGSAAAGFPSGKEAMIVNGYWTPGELAKTAADPSWEFGYNWAPTRTGEKLQRTGGWLAGIPRGATYPDASWRFIEYLGTPEPNQILLDNAGGFAYSKPFAAQANFGKYKGLQWFVDSVAKADRIPALENAPIAAQVRDKFGKGVQDVNFGRKTAQEMLDELQQQMQTELDRLLKS